MDAATEQRARQIAVDVMTLARNRLTVDLRYMANPISMLQLTEAPGMDSIMADGRRLWYDPIHILQSYQQARELPVRKYLHVVLHCIYQHFFVNMQVDRRLWDLAADIAVEATIAEAAVPSAAVGSLDRAQEKEIASIRKAVPHMTAEVIYRYLRDLAPAPARLDELRALFSIDSHDAWYEQSPNGDEGEPAARSSESGSGTGAAGRPDGSGTPQDAGDMEPDEDSNDGEDGQGAGQSDEQGSGSSGDGGAGAPDESAGSNDARGRFGQADMKALTDDWKRAAEQMRMDIRAFGGRRQGTDPGNGLMDNLNYAVREKYDYAAFLRQFGVLGETMKINDEEFDYSFYCYGIDRYGNMPLIEPLEYKDTHKIREFVIAIDTSGSTAGDLVEMFLRKTYNILKQRENFHTRINVRVIQCDAAIQDDVKITKPEELEEYMRTMKIRGGGGTDFRPVFTYVDDLIANGELPNLGGLIYFTDGFGTFPNYQPPFKTAFVFVNDGYDDPEIPVWGIKLILEPEDIEELAV